MQFLSSFCRVPCLTQCLRGNHFHVRIIKLQLQFMSFITLPVIYTQTYFHYNIYHTLVKKYRNYVVFCTFFRVPCLTRCLRGNCFHLIIYIYQTTYIYIPYIYTNIYIPNFHLITYIPNQLFPYNFCNLLSLDNNVIVYKKIIEQGHLVLFYSVHTIERNSVYMELEQINIHKK